ncbi:MAG TPA: DUF1800 domain-containing protein [Candidatus Baltobacteraceae bacterium]|jgi:uncharacterized protein (DUF1800 family)|nr:DUF1800 domain-containing protein [Candidatus Baltobacteraceae bacterium]
MNANTPFRPVGSLSVSSALQTYTGPWNERLAAHLLRRAGFGGTPADVKRFAGMSMHRAVDSLIHFPATGALASQPDGILDLEENQERLYREERMERQQRTILSDGAPGRTDPELVTRQEELGMLRRQATVTLQTWWLERMIATPAPLQEKMTLFWHGHFTSGLNEKGTGPAEAFAQNELFRSNALGNIRDLTLQVSRDPAMLKYLDNRTNLKAHPNENFARELMELYTLGIGNYSEEDVRESARAWTGWTLMPPNMGAGSVFNVRQHDDGVKTFLGRSGAFGGTDIVSIIFEQPAAARWFAAKLLNFFVYNDPEPALIDVVAELIGRNDFNLQPVMSTLLRSQVFYSSRAYRALVKSPVEYVVGICTLYGIGKVEPRTLSALGQMGQALFHPPNVKGWGDGTYWLNSQSLLARENFANAVVMSQDAFSDASWLGATRSDDPARLAQVLVDRILQGDVSPATLVRLRSYLDGSDVSVNGMLSGENFEQRVRSGAYLTMVLPAYQLA